MIDRPDDEGAAPVNEAILREAQHFAELAGIDVRWIWTPFADVLGDEVAWLRRFRKQTRSLLYTGNAKEAFRRMACITGSLVRNEVDARLRSIHDTPDFGSLTREKARLVLLHDFLTHESVSARIQTETARVVMDRLNRQRLIVVYARQVSDIEATYGGAVASYFEPAADCFIRIDL